MHFHRLYLPFISLVLILFAAACAPTQAANPAAAPTQPAAVASPASATSPAGTATESVAQPAQAPTEAPVAAVAPSCTSPAAATPAMTEGPYFKAGSPERASLLEPGMNGTKLVLAGYVLTKNCKPIAHALVDFWQADASGQYDNSGYTLRGHQFTDANGRYELTTVIPGLYPGRTEHMHVKVQAPNGPVLTTQLFFPGVQSNARDSIFDSRLLMKLEPSGDGQVGAYDFVLNQ